MLRQIVKRFRRDERGIAAIEFATLGPLFAVSTVLAADIGFAALARVNMDQSLRGAAQVAMANVKDATQLKTAVEQAFVGSVPAPVVTAKSVCECTVGTEADCYTPCSGGAAPSIFVDLTMQKTHNAMLMPDFTLRTSMSVRLR